MNLHTPSRDAYGYTKGTPDYERLSKMFTSVVRGNNFFTPNILGYVELPNGVAEISKGVQPFAGSEHLPMFGVTIVVDGKKSDKSTSLSSYSDVVNYVNNLNNE